MLAYQIFLTVLAVLLLVVPAYLLYSNVVDASGAKDLPEKSMQLAAPINEYYGKPTEVSPPDPHKYPSDICVTFEMLSIDPSSSFANLGMLVGVTDHGRKVLKGLAKGYKNVTVWATSYSGLSTVHVTVPISTLVHAPASTCGSGQVRSECPLGQAGDKTICSAELDQHAAFRETGSDYILGQARAFPQDWYQLDDLVAVRDGVDIGGHPLRSSLLMMTRDDNFTTKVHLDDKKLHNWQFQHMLMFTMRRPLRIVAYTYWISALPFLLIVAILARQWIARRDTPKPYEVAFGIAATLLAILSLRTVLVPTSLPALTRLDLIFGIGVTLLVVGSIIWMGIWSSGGSGTGADAPGTADHKAGSTTGEGANATGEAGNATA